MQKAMEKNAAGGDATPHSGARPLALEAPRSHGGRDGVAAGLLAPITQLAQLSLPVAAAARTRRGFLDLPAEIRNSIYLLLLEHDGSINIVTPSDDGSSPRARVPIPRNILSTCRTVMHEAMPILWGVNEFWFHLPGTMPAFIDKAGDRAELLRSVVIPDLGGPSTFIDAIARLEQSTDLQSIKFEHGAMGLHSSREMSSMLMPLARALWTASIGKDGISEISIVERFNFADSQMVRINFTNVIGGVAEKRLIGRGVELNFAVKLDEWQQYRKAYWGGSDKERDREDNAKLGRYVRRPDSVRWSLRAWSDMLSELQALQVE